MSDKDVVITRTNHDDGNRYLFYWTEEVVDFANRSGFRVSDLKKSRVNKRDVSAFIRRKRPRFILFNGHGTPDTIKGHDNENLIILDRNVDLLKSKIVYARACFSANGIGRKCKDMDPSGCFIGYSHKYIWAADERCMANPLTDELAKPFYESSNIIPIAILKGNTVEEALKRSREIMEKYIEFYEAHSSLPGASDIVFFLKWDLSNQKFLGDKEASIPRP